MTPLARYLSPAIIAQVERLDLRARFIIEGYLAGRHRSSMHGFSVEFSEHRHYVPGDEPRSVDWKVFARTDRLFVRTYQAETQLACHVLVDRSASMGAVGIEPLESASATSTASQHAAGASLTKLEYAVSLAAALAYLLHRQRDALGLAVLGDRLERMIPARARVDHLADVLAALSQLAPGGTTGVAAAIGDVLRHVPHRGLVILLSDLLTDPGGILEALHQVRFRGHDLIVMHVLDAAETSLPFRGPVVLEDPETGQQVTADADAVRPRYLAALAAWRSELASRLAGLRADYVPLDTAEPFDRALGRFLVRRAKRR